MENNSFLFEQPNLTYLLYEMNSTEYSINNIIFHWNPGNSDNDQIQNTPQRRYNIILHSYIYIILETFVSTELQECDLQSYVSRVCPFSDKRVFWIFFVE